MCKLITMHSFSPFNKLEQIRSHGYAIHAQTHRHSQSAYRKVSMTEATLKQKFAVPEIFLGFLLQSPVFVVTALYTSVIYANRE